METLPTNGGHQSGKFSLDRTGWQCDFAAPTMRQKAIDHFLDAVTRHGVETKDKSCIDVGGNEKVYLQTNERVPVAQDKEAAFRFLRFLGAPLPEAELNVVVTRNPLLSILPNLRFLDPGFTAETTGSGLDIKGDLLVEADVARIEGRFDVVVSFDTLEHVSDPFTFCRNFVRLAKPGAFLYLATVFSWVYHPSPEDYFRFSPTGLARCFEGADAVLLESDWVEKEISVFACLRRK
ncbi:MAG: methyltransferase domain-containing protein [Myxococcales bacterium]|jgi:SAM-dependent methyltransferase|nr:methyltransferase domain-containing protein [Myxococcales bacterium]